MAVADHQTLRVLEGRYVLERVDPVVGVADGDAVLAVVRGPDGGACMRRDDGADDVADDVAGDVAGDNSGAPWVALWNGDAAHPPDATGMLAAIVAPLAAGEVPVWVAASFDGDVVCVPAVQLGEAVELLRRSGHQVIN